MDNYYKENCAGLARRVEIFRGEFVKKSGIPAIAHASVSPALIIRMLDLVPSGNFLLNFRYFKTTCNIRPFFLLFFYF